MKKQWHVYILQCANRAYYTGITNDIEKRLNAHNSKKGGRYTRAFGPVRLLWSEPQSDKSSALKRERQIKAWPRSKKQALIARILNTSE